MKTTGKRTMLCLRENDTIFGSGPIPLSYIAGYPLDSVFLQESHVPCVENYEVPLLQSPSALGNGTRLTTPRDDPS